MKTSKRIKVFAITLFLKLIANHVNQHRISVREARFWKMLIQPLGRVIAKELNHGVVAVRASRNNRWTMARSITKTISIAESVGKQGPDPNYPSGAKVFLPRDYFIRDGESRFLEIACSGIT